MEISYVLKDCTFKHNKYSVVEAETWKDKDLIKVVLYHGKAWEIE